MLRRKNELDWSGGCYAITQLEDPGLERHLSPEGTGLLKDPERAKALMVLAFESIQSVSPEVSSAAIAAVRLRNQRQLTEQILQIDQGRDL